MEPEQAGGADEDSWGDEVPVQDLNQSDDDAVAPAAFAAADGDWVSEEEAPADSREAEESPRDAGDAASSLAAQLYSLQDRLAESERAARLEAENDVLRARLDEAAAELQLRGERVQELRAAQLDILASVTSLKQSHRGFQTAVLNLLENVSTLEQVDEVTRSIRALISQQRAREAEAEARENADDSAVLASMAHPVDKLMRLTRNVNPLESSFQLVRWALRLEGAFVAPHAPLVVVLVDKMLRYWEALGEMQLYPLYSVICTHFLSRLQRVAEQPDALLAVVTNLMAFFYLVRSDFDAAESTDVVLLRSLQHVLLGLNGPHGEDFDAGEDAAAASGMLSLSGKPVSPSRPGKILVKSKRAFWVELRKLVVLGYALIVRNEAEKVEDCSRQTLEYIRERANEKVTYVGSDECSPGMQKMLVQFDELQVLLNKASAPMALSLQVFGQLMTLFNGLCCNALMLRRAYATMHAASCFRGDLRSLEGWLRTNMPSDAFEWFQKKLCPLTEMINILFMNKQQLTRPEIRNELCSHVTPAQVCQLLTTYQPQPGEASVPLSLIQSLMVAGKSHQADIKAVLIDVTLLEPIDLSVFKPYWLTRLTFRELKDAPLPMDICEEFIIFREKARSKQ